MTYTTCKGYLKLYEDPKCALRQAKKNWADKNWADENVGENPTDFGYNKYRDVDTNRIYHEFIFDDESITNQAANWYDDEEIVRKIYLCGFTNAEIADLYDYEDEWIQSVEDMGDSEFRIVRKL